MPPDPDLPVDLLRRLYVEQNLTTRAIAEQTGVSRGRVTHALAAAGIPARGYSARRRGSRRDRISDELIRELYVDQGLHLHQLAERFGVTVEYLSSRCRAIGVVPRPGAFISRTRYSDAELDAEAAQLYTSGLNVHQAGERLGISPSTVLDALHRAHVPLRGKGFRGRHVAPRTLIEDLYGDPVIGECLRRHGVHQPAASDWRPASRWQNYAPLPLSGQLVRELYAEIGLSVAHIAMLCGVGKTLVRNRLHEHDVPMRDSHMPCPGNARQHRSH